MTPEERVVLWQKNALVAVQNQRDLLIFVINALDQVEPDQLKDTLVEMLIMTRDIVATTEEHIL